MEPIQDWLEETMRKAGLDKKTVRIGAADVTFKSDHHVFDAELPRDLQSEDELYGAPVVAKKIVGREARADQALLAQVVNTFAALEATAPTGKPLDNQKPYEEMTDGEKFGRDAVTLPHHYARYAIEPIRFAVENNLNFLQANIVKYILRFDAKNGMEDLNKAERYLTLLKRFAAKDPDWWRP